MYVSWILIVREHNLTRGLRLMLGCWIILLAGSSIIWGSTSRVLAQQPTGSIPTVTGTPSGPILTVHAGWEEQINVRAGPGQNYDAVGILVIGQWLPAVGQISNGEWIKITYLGAPNDTGWVMAALVDLKGELPVIEVPPTPTPRTTPTTDPTLAAQYIVAIPATRLPTFTPPDRLAIPTFAPESPARSSRGVPMGLVIIGLGVVGVFGALISLLRGR
jgi:hypothetical protein